MKPLRTLKCIEMTHIDTDGNTSKTMLSYYQFKKSFINERWTGERRTGKTFTIFGDAHKKTTVTSPTGKKSIRTFDFPKSREEAEQRDSESEGK